jgi:Ca2+-binding RTX toxin-like protein
MSKLQRKALITTNVALATCAATVAFARAGSPIIIAASYPSERGGVSSMGVTGDDAANEVEVRFIAHTDEFPDGQYVVSDSNGVSPGANCSSVSPGEVTCQRFPAGVRDSFAVVLAGGDDRFTFVGDPHGSRIYPGTGNDQALGGRSRDVMFGEDGRDSLRGRDGNDRLDGGLQRDELLGGSGNDRLSAADDERDAMINCGPGDHDVAQVDARLDPATIGCERVQKN